MGRPITIDKKLPPEIRRELVARIFSAEGHSKPALREWLAELGFTFSRSTFNRYVNKLRGALNLDTLPIQHRPEPATLTAALILQEIGGLMVQEEEIQRRKRLLFEEIARQGISTAPPP